MSSHKLRDYQQKAVEEIRAHYASGRKKVLLHLSTGAGKTTVFSYILKELSARGNRGVMVVRGRALVDQASKRLFHEEVPHGVLMNGAWNVNKKALVQVASVDTACSRNEFPEAMLIVIDECHMWHGPETKRFLDQYPDAYVLAVTATPYGDKPMRHFADVVVQPITTQELIDRGYLVAPRYFAPTEPDLKGVKKSKGEYNQDQLSTRMSTLSGDIVKHWIELGDNRPTLCFAVKVDHSKLLVEQFKSVGIAAEHVDANSTDAERAAAIERLRTGETKILSNVGILCTGVDIPFLGCIISARPTLSYNLYIQQMGRGTRLFEGKKDFIILDHAGNILKHGFITSEREVDLDGAKPKDPIFKPKRCEECYGVYVGSFCDMCGAKPAKVERERAGITIDLEGRLQEIMPGSSGSNILKFIADQNTIARRKGYSKGWIYHSVKNEFGEDIAKKMFPQQAQQAKWKNR